MRELHRAVPFKPFAIRLADGRAIEVVHPDYLMFSPKGRTAAVYRRNGLLNVVDVMLITDLEVVESPPRKRGRVRHGR